MIEQPYTYTEQVNHLKATVELGFVIQDTSEAVLIPTVPILETQEKPFAVLENVKPDDTTGVRAEGEVPSETKFMETVENTARDRLLTQAKEKVGSLPPLDPPDRGPQGRRSRQRRSRRIVHALPRLDREPRYPERRRAQKFLLDNYNFRAYGDSPKA